MVRSIGIGLGRGLIAVMAPLTLGATGLTNNLEWRVIAAQNRERATLGIAPLQWSPRLAASAAAWADHLGETGAFEHAPEKPGQPEGENIWAGSRGYYSAEAMVGAWIAEKRVFKPGLFPNNSRTGRYEDVGHYTQLMWRGTGKVGCAWATSKVEDILVCRYSDAGNYIGEEPF